MKTVLAAVVGSAKLRPVRPESEGVGRRAIALVPNRGSEVMVGA